MIQDPEMVNELYVTKNKYFDKGDKFYRIWHMLFGESILMTKSNELWSIKRKHISTAFYKDKMFAMLLMII